MKKFLSAMLLVTLLLAGSAFAEPESTDSAATAEPAETDTASAADTVALAFEDGFSLDLPSGWLHYSVTQEMADKGVLYCLSDAQGTHQLYIQSWTTDCTDIDAMLALINNAAAPKNSGIYNFNGTDFVVYDLSEGDVSCCVTLLNGHALNFVFTPQSDADFMVTAAEIIGSFTVR